MCTFCFCLFYVGKKKKRKHEKNGKIKFQKKPRKIVFFGWLWRKMFFFVKMSFLEKQANTICVRKVKKGAHFRCNYLFLENVTFSGAHSKSPNTTKIGVLADTRENPKWHFWLQKCHFGFALEKGFYYLWCLKAVFRWKHYFYSVFSKTFGGSAFCCLCFCLVFCKKAQEGYFPAILEVFCLFCSHQRPVLKCFFSSNFLFFAFVFLFKNPFLYFLFVHQPLFNKRLFVGFLLFFFCLSFPFLSFACLFDPNFPNIPFLKSNLLSFLPVSFFFCCCCFCSHCVCFSLSVFCCYVGFVFGVFVLFCFVFLFLFFFLVLLSVSEKKAVFPAILVFVWAMLVKRVVWFYVLCFCSCLFFFLCCFFPV